MKTTSVLWIGKEQEGEFAGTKTLFVGSPDVTFEKIKEVLSDYSKIEQIYFGAGRCTRIDQEVVRQCLEAFAPKGIFITMEISLNRLRVFDDKLLKQTCVIVTINSWHFGMMSKLNPKLAQVKLQNLNKASSDKMLMLGKLSEFKITDISTLDGKTYTGDEVIR